MTRQGDEPVKEAGRAHHKFTVRRRLLILAGALVLPTIAAMVALLDHVYESEKAASEFQFQATARALSLVVDRQLGQMEAQLRTLATSRSLADDNFVAFDRRARLVSGGEGSWIVLRNPAGIHLVNTRFPPGASLPTAVRPDEERDRILAGGPYVSNLIADSPVGHPVIGVDIPIMRDGVLVYDLAMVLPAANFTRIFVDQRMPSSWVAAIIDRRGRVVARSRANDQSVGVSVPKDFLDQLQSSPEGVLPGRSIEGVKTLFAYSRSATSGWVFGVAVPQAEVGSTARRSVYVAIVIGFGLLGLGALVARRVARGIAQPIEGLAAQATALGRGESISQVPSGLVEADLVAAALVQASESLRLFTATLEQRVIERTKDLEEANRRLSVEIDERKRAEEQLARVQRMEAIGQLTGGVAHDFNNLLQTVIGNLDMLRRDAANPTSLKMIENALRAAERGANLTGQLLAFARRQRLEAGPVDVNAVIVGTAEMLRGTIGGAVSVETELADGLWFALADTTQLELMILNLAINARDAMPQGGRIRIATANVVRGAPTRPEEPEAGEYVELTVSDEGVGMPSEVLSRVFEPFFTTKPVGKGSGLGLSQVLGLAQQQRGGVTIDSRPGTGTAVRIYLPRATPQEVRLPDRPPRNEEQRSLAGLPVLLADDDTEVREVLAGILTDLGCRVTDVNSGQAVLDTLGGQDPFELLIVDYAMPGMSGSETAVRARVIRPGLTILMLTGYAQADFLPPDLPPEHIITKPVRPLELAETIRAVLAKKRSEPRNAAQSPDRAEGQAP